ncbi:glycosyltransferase family 2 protein [Phlebiopsis gigantea 11061_1 CR5-6]|uniref:chitin synthase n=1 Tax=Phlebiopsis gigantea (strain 11061_1 CR5-6) TaxID=745531 RepID=A0A0C3S6I9_PHLG1|nr:glycosyltransferase family 2 protein [Phlebiopsis gigantea 11061_1 CR5-6]
MDHRGQRPPRSARPPGPQIPAPPYQSQTGFVPGRTPLPEYPSEPQRGISFQNTERGDRQAPLDQSRQRQYSAYQPQSPPLDGGFAEAGGVPVGRKKSLVRPDREKIDPGHRQYHYHTRVAELQEEGGNVKPMPSSTGNMPGLRRGKSLLGREEDQHESGLALFKRGTLRRKKAAAQADSSHQSEGCLGNIGPGPKNGWFIFCYIITCWVPPPLLRACGIRTPEQQRAWREKIGLLTIIGTLMAGVGFLTFGFTEAVCGTPPNRFHSGTIENASVIIHGYDYDFSRFKHPKAGSTFNGQSNPLLEGNWHIAGADISFMFQNVGQNCKQFITKAANSSIAGNTEPEWYFPCNVYNQFGTSLQNLTGYGSSASCHVTATSRTDLASMKPQGQVYYTWDDVRNPNRNLAVFESTVLDFDLLKWLSSAEVQFPDIFNDFMKRNGTFNGKDVSMYLLRTNQNTLGHCLQDIITVGFIDTNSIGCVASQVVLYVSLVFIIGVVGIRFFMAVMFAWFFSWRIGNFKNETYEQRMKRAAEIENWTEDIYRPAPSQYRPNVHKSGLNKGFKGVLPSTSRFTPSDNVLKGMGGGRQSTAYGMLEPMPYKRNTSSMYGSSRKSVAKLTPPDTPATRQSRSSTSLDQSAKFADNPCPFPLHNVIPQPPLDYEPFNYPLAHTICLVTAYSESVEGLRTTLDSLATTDYPNSHKLILIIADGMVKGAGNNLTTPEICLTMMKEFIIEPAEVEAHSYVAIADGHKRHNMAKVYAGFYAYDDATIERSKQQKVPVVLVAKCGNPLEAGDAKPGNRGKRDSQIVLMAFMQKVMFDERMTTFEYEFFNSIWRVTGVSPDRYELVLCVDADTKVFPDSLSRMGSCMVNDYEIMGLCGETKIANKAETWVTMIQVFEYYISHHMTKAFESMFGGVTCLPGCFSMYRIKAPKGDSGYWVPILANPDVVEHYSENVVDTLHKKNLLLLGEDRYLTTLMLKTFPKRKNVFCPQAVCKTVVPDTFHVLLSQRRRWINSTIHNLAELLLVRDLCGTFCFSMQFVVGMELAGTLVLPAAISFTLYLIIISIIPGGTNTTIPLVLLAIVLGLPGFLIVITSRKIAYVGWMLVYLLSLPIWNGILPAYAFWHFDDFSWGQTRQVAGDKKISDNHGDKEGEFDSSHIVMKKWVEFERERRWKAGSQSRDSTYYGNGSPKRADSNRFSMVSTSDYHHQNQGYDTSTFDSGVATAPRRQDPNQLLMLPAPLSVNRMTPTSASTSTGALSRSSEEGGYNSDIGSQQQRLISPQEGYAYSEEYEPSPPAASQYVQQSPFDARVSRTAVSNNAVYRQSSANQYTHQQFSYTNEPEEISAHPSEAAARRGSRGVNLVDNGPIQTSQGVRRISRQTRRSTAQAPTQNQNRYSRGNSMPMPQQQYGNLPPGAAPPQQGYGY